MGEESGALQNPGRRRFLTGAGVLGLLAFVPPVRLSRLLASSPAPGQAGRFLTAQQLTTLRAVCSRLIPGPPDDPFPGALEAMVPEAIDLLLGAFSVTPPMIHAGGPFSNRAGSSVNDFADFIPLDAFAELGWRIRLEGSLGIPEREFAGPVVGLQQIYQAGLADLDAAAQSTYGVRFAGATSAQQDALLYNPNADATTQTLVSVAFANCLEAMYGPPEYGGNKSLIGWSYTSWPGDVQPLGYTNQQVSGPNPSSPTAPPASPGAALPGAQRSLVFQSGRPATRSEFWLWRRGLLRGH